MLKKLFISLILLLALPSCTEYSPSHTGFTKLEQIKSEGEIRFITRHSPSTYYQSAEGIKGLEYDLAVLFAEYLEVKPKFIIPDTFKGVLDQISNNTADIAAAGLTITDNRKQQVRFGETYQTITEQIIYRSGNKRPKKMTDLREGILEIAQGTSYFETLTRIKGEYPDLNWIINSEQTTNGLMHLVNEGLIDYTIADSHHIGAIRKFYPKLKIAFDVSGGRELAWAMPLSNDNTLYNKVNDFFSKIKTDKTLEHLLDKYYGNSDNLNYASNCIFRQHIKDRLTQYETFFKEQEKKHNIDWRLFAAIAYQESHWQSDAISPTGVKGLMMLTQGTARQMGIANRVDPLQSIIGGTLYFKEMLNRIPEHITEPDRTWFALASYNVGFGHLSDARGLTKKRKGNPDKWLDVKKTLPLLSEEEWYKQTKYGYARGKEPVKYVKNIRSYYELLVWLTEENEIENKAMEFKPEKQKYAESDLLIPSS
jgi:membrane-bound lytic murein transglycosylase F